MNPAPPVTRTFMGGPLRGRHFYGLAVLEHALVRAYPIPEAAEPRFLVDLRLPSHVATRSPDVADVAALVARSPVAERHVHLSLTQSLEDRPELVPDGECVLRSAADVVDVSGGSIDLLSRQPQGSHQVLDEQDIADLLAVSIDGQRLSRRGRDEEVRQPPLVFVSELTRAVDAAHSKDDCREVVDARVVADVLIACPF